MVVESNGEYPLGKAYNFKKTKYTPPEPLVKKQDSTIKGVKTHGFPMGTRGLWYKGNVQVLEDLDITNTKTSTSKLFARPTILYSTDHLRNFFNMTYAEGGPALGGEQ